MDWTKWRKDKLYKVMSNMEQEELDDVEECVAICERFIKILEEDIKEDKEKMR